MLAPKDSQRYLVELGQKAQYYYWEITLTENQIWFGPILDIQGNARISLGVYNLGTSPGALASCSVWICSDAQCSKYVVFKSSAPGVGSVYYMSDIPPSRYIQPYVKAGTTPGTYSVQYWLAIYPVGG